ncbi:MAG: acylphosphatase [Candidatus Korarchaeota archaeon]|nr:acylphosphatase [Candidatus Korarchaeota archaeon]
MKRKLLIKGKKVQDIGYRMFLLSLASEHDLTGFQARNVGKNVVEAVYEGRDDEVRAFEADVRELMPEGAEVEEIHFEDYDGPVKDIEKFRSYFTTLQLGKMIEVGVGMLQRQDIMLQKQELMLQRQEETLNELRAFREESRRNQELMIKKLDTISLRQEETLNELRGVRGDLRSFLEDRLARLERDVLMIKERLGIK